MNNIEVGDYLRIFGMITEVTAIDEDYIDVDNKELICIPKGSFKYTTYKHSKNIIDLIEVGDYVNGEKVVIITNDRHLLLDRDVDVLDKYRTIKSIVTKEMFLNAEYRVETN